MTKRTMLVGISLMVVVGLAAALWVAPREPATTPAGPPMGDSEAWNESNKYFVEYHIIIYSRFGYPATRGT